MKELLENPVYCQKGNLDPEENETRQNCKLNCSNTQPSKAIFGFRIY